ncbi:hypothetical protein PLEOSDRAFT_169311 [Pleurotus ostreatus PC15]|uniref:Uncharacterized protein n=1 Tax=Pleurotus ostreatus (strain PC15) TaxID=1137138 RepID=A0A067NBJ8_PLEO1|nr:hypothetical protein PLEOSDRAFT_169311 [Pleurotus ostreatus PC15]
MTCGLVEIHRSFSVIPPYTTEYWPLNGSSMVTLVGDRPAHLPIFPDSVQHSFSPLGIPRKSQSTLTVASMTLALSRRQRYIKAQLLGPRIIRRSFEVWIPMDSSRVPPTISAILFREKIARNSLTHPIPQEGQGPDRRALDVTKTRNHAIVSNISKLLLLPSRFSVAEWEKRNGKSTSNDARETSREPKPVARTTFLDVAAFAVFESLKAVDIHCPFFNASRAIVLIHDMVCNVYSNKKAFAELATEAITTLNTMDREVTNAKKAGRELSESQKTRINEFTGLITEHLGRSLFDRVFRSNKDASTISGFQRKLAKAQEDFMTCSMISVESKLDDGVSILNQVVQHQLHSQSLLVPVRKRVKRKTATNKLKPEHTLRPMTSSTSSSLSSQFSEESTPIQPPRGSTVMTNSGNGVFNNVGGAQYNSGTNFGTTKTFRPRVNPKVSTASPIKVGAMRTGKGTGVGSGPGLEARFGRDRSACYGGRQVAMSAQSCTDDYFDGTDIYGTSPSLQKSKDEHEEEQYDEGEAESEEDSEDEGNNEEDEKDEGGSSNEDEDMSD